MQKHWRAIQWASILALAVFIVFAMAEKYLLLHATITAVFVFGTAYLIAVARFKDRPDAETGAHRPGH
jgi:hypothetical protein